jgi:hypothetical protein
MNRLAPALVLALVLAVPVAASAKHRSTPAPAAGMPATSASIPTCPENDPVVWVNTSTHVYHAQGTTFFGTTKHGKYACTLAATAMGAHASGASSMKRGAAIAPAATPAPAGKKHHRKSGAMMPAASPTPM